MNVRTQLYINGQWREASTTKKLYSPYSGELIAEVAQANESEADEAIEASRAAARVIAKMPAHKRATILDNVAAILERRRAELVRILVLEAAKPEKAAKNEISRTIQTYKFAAMEARRIHGETVPLDAAPGGEGRIAFTLRKPIGVIGAITSFNFPFNLVAHKVGPAIAAGNAIVLKPADQTPLSALVLGEIFHEAGLPAGVLNIIPGTGSVIGEKLVKDPRIAAITFTGSVEVGREIRSKAGLKRVVLELGSNSALIIDDTVELTSELIERCVEGGFSYNGQVCISIQRILVHENKYEEFIAKYKTEVEKLVIGDPLESATDVTALIHPQEVKRLHDWVSSATSRGAQIVTGGQAISSRIYAPTILTNVAHDEPISCKEVFGPIVTVSSYRSLEEAVAEVNNSRYGLQAGIFTNDIHTAMRAAEDLEVGGVMINDIPTFRVDHMPYGGVKDSGIGREGIKYAVEELTELKLISMKLKTQETIVNNN
jgi:acyl-CoA reductase-like NAD-dependent aldehyde dehydrogenase